jgi:YaaC-like Protein
MASGMWHYLRLTRTRPPGEAGRGHELASIYRSSLQQAEDLMVAAEQTGPSARPLPLFYGLSQAGRAIVTARSGPGHKRHGLRVPDPQPAESLLSASVAPTRQPGQFQAVAEATGSPGISVAVELGALLACLPELEDEFLIELPKWPRPLPVWPDEDDYAWLDRDNVSTQVVFPEAARTAKEVAETLSRYPGAHNRCQLVKAETIMNELPKRPTPSGMGTKVLWGRADAGIEIGAPEYRWRGRRWVWPAIVEGEDPPSPLLIWWALLFLLSMLARYHPEAWVDALDPDKSRLAVPLERVMAEALEAVPQLVLQAILDEQVLV